MNPVTNLEKVERYLRSIENGDFAYIADLFWPDAVVVTMSFAERKCVTSNSPAGRPIQFEKTFQRLFNWGSFGLDCRYECSDRRICSASRARRVWACGKLRTPLSHGDKLRL